MGSTTTNRLDILFGHELSDMFVFALYTEQEGIPLFTSLSYLPKTSPGLHSMVFNTEEPLASSRLEQLIEQLPQLRKLELRNLSKSNIGLLSTTFIARLATLKHLRTFVTSYALRRFRSASGYHQLPSTTFPLLLDLRIAVPVPVNGWEGLWQGLSLWSSTLLPYSLPSMARLEVTPRSLSARVSPRDVSSSDHLRAIEDMIRTIVMAVSHATLSVWSEGKGGVGNGAGRERARRQLTRNDGDGKGNKI